jgi:hypothetical protein
MPRENIPSASRPKEVRQTAPATSTSSDAITKRLYADPPGNSNQTEATKTKSILQSDSTSNSTSSNRVRFDRKTSGDNVTKTKKPGVDEEKRADKRMDKEADKLIDDIFKKQGLK